MDRLADKISVEIIYFHVHVGTIVDKHDSWIEIQIIPVRDFGLTQDNLTKYTAIILPVASVTETIRH